MVEECGQVESLLMPPNKPYSFVQYGRTTDSKQAYDSLNGKELILDNSSQKVVLYFNYVEKGITEEACFSTVFPQHAVRELGSYLMKLREALISFEKLA